MSMMIKLNEIIFGDLGSVFMILSMIWIAFVLDENGMEIGMVTSLYNDNGLIVFYHHF